jgi:Mg2+-importing ATPase
MPDNKTAAIAAESVLPLREISALSADEALKRLRSRAEGLTHAEAQKRLAEYGFNEAQAEKHDNWFWALLLNFKNPLVILLVILAALSYFTGDDKTSILIVLMIVLSVGLRFFQEKRADSAAKKLKRLVHTTATVLRNGIKKEIPLRQIVPGDVVELSAGDMIPADIRLISSHNLYVNQAVLTGEAFAAEKTAEAPRGALVHVAETDLPNQCVVRTGAATKFGALSGRLGELREVTNFDKGIKHFTWLMIKLMLFLTPAVFIANGLSKGNWGEAFFFALAVAVGLTPELLPMIVTVNLSKGALKMSRNKVIVKRLNAIQNFGAMDILCTDKTGTLTDGRVALIQYLDVCGKEEKSVLELATLNSYFQTGLKNLMDEAVLRFNSAARTVARSYAKVDEMPFDFNRRRMSVVVKPRSGKTMIITKGAVEEVLAVCTSVKDENAVRPINKAHHEFKNKIVAKLNGEGFRLIAVAVRETDGAQKAYSTADEKDMTLIGFLAFLDPPKPSAGAAVRKLETLGVKVKILTGDNGLVTAKICREVNLPVTGSLSGEEIAKMSDKELAEAAVKTDVFYKLTPADKERIIRALKSAGHAVGFLGDGINDAPALRAADVGISVDGAVDIAKESSDIILLEKSLSVLANGVREGRKVFGNIVKYLKMAASSNFGNMFSVLGASIFLPFLPMLPLQVIVNNMLYDVSQTGIPSDAVDEEYIKKPRQWDIKAIEKFIYRMGPVSSLFDYATFGLMLFAFNAWVNPALFHTAWFVESIVSQTLIIHILRTNKLPFFQSRASKALTATTTAAVAIGIWLPYSPLAATLGFVPLPFLFWIALAAIIVLYFLLAQFVKTRFSRDEA